MPKFDLTTVELGDPATRLLTVEEAATEILLALPVTPPETVPLSDALGRVAAQNVTARLNHPPAPVSAMDGYALFSRDVRELPARLRKIGVSRAGMPFRGELVPGTCVRIFTGGVIPAGADLIALQEDVLATEDLVHIRAVPKVSQYIRQAAGQRRRTDPPSRLGAANRKGRDGAGRALRQRRPVLMGGAQPALRPLRASRPRARVSSLTESCAIFSIER